MVVLLSALGVVIFRNPIYSALCLITNLLCVAGLFAMLDAHFLATVQIIVYAGAIMVLVLFLIMLLNIKIEKPKSMRTVFTLVSIFAGFLFLRLIVPPLNSFFQAFDDPVLPIEGGVRAVGELLYTKYVFPFEIASVLILAAMIGSVMLAKSSYEEK